MTLSAIQSPSGKYTLLEFSRPFGLAEAAGLQLATEIQPEFTHLLQQSATELLPHVSGAVLDAHYTYPVLQHKPDGVGVVFSLNTQTESLDPLALPRLAENWGVEYVRNNYGVALLELYYHPAEELAYKKQQFVAEMYDSCKYHGINFILQLFVYHPLSEPPEPMVMHETQLQSVQTFARFCNLLAIEYLGDPLAAATITANIDVPWLMTSRSVNYETTKSDLRVALESGAQGFLLGDVFWPALPTAQRGIQQALAAVQTTGRDRLLELSRIVNES